MTLAHFLEDIACTATRRELLSRLSHGLARIRRTAPRTIASPPTQPRRASVAILLRVRPHPDDERALAAQYDPEGQPLPGTDASAARAASTAVGSMTADACASTAGAHAGASNTAKGAMQESFTSSLLPSESSVASILPATSASASLRRDSQESSSGGPPGVPGSPVTSSGASGIGAMPASGERRSSEMLSSFFAQPWVQRGVPEVLYIKRAARASDKWSSHVAFPGGRAEPEDENGLYTAMRETWEEVGIDLAENEYACVGQLDDREITTSLGKRLLMVLSPFGE